MIIINRNNHNNNINQIISTIFIIITSGTHAKDHTQKGAKRGGRGRHINRFDKGSKSQEGISRWWPKGEGEAGISTDLTGDLDLKKASQVGGPRGGERQAYHQI